MPSNTEIDGYFKILGCKKGDSKDVVKKAYRTLSKKYHPDKQAKSSDEEKKVAEEKIKEITAAWKFLDKNWDRLDIMYSDRIDPSSFFTNRTSSSSHHVFVNGREVSPEEFNEMFNSRAGFHREPPIDVRLQLQVPLNIAYEGGETPITYERKTFRNSNGLSVSSFSQNTVNIKIPKRAKLGHQVVVDGAGNIDEEKGKTGNLIVVISVERSYKGTTLLNNGSMQKEIVAPWGAALGGNKIKVPIFKGSKKDTVNIKLNSEKPSGDVYEVKDKGYLPSASFFVKVHYSLPENIEESDREALAKILKKYV